MPNNNAESRSYGQGAQGEVAPAQYKKTGFWTKVRYNFDNSIAKPSAFVFYMFIALIILSVLVVLIKYALYAVPALLPAGTAALSDISFETFWGQFATLTGRGTEATWADRIVGILNWSITITVAGSVTGFIVGAINRAFAAMRKGKSPIIDNGHTLILGWSNRVFPILKELAIANSNVRRPKVVIFSQHEREFMEDEIESRAEGLGKLKVITRTGDPTNPADLKRVNVSSAKSVIILDADETGDATVVSTVLAVKSVNSNPDIKMIAELDDANTAEALVNATQGQVIAVRSHDVIARVTAQASRQPGLAAVALDLLDFDGDEIYFQQVPALDGKTYKDAVSSFNTASVIGVVGPDGKTALNPKPATKIKAGSKVIAIAEDDDKVVFTGITDKAAARKVPARKAITRKAEHLLVIGWSSMGRSVLTELASYLPKGSSVHIVAQSKFVAADELKNLKFGAVKVTHASVSGDIDELIAAASAKRYDEVIVLGYREAITESEADAQTMLTMLQMNQLFEQDGNGVEPTRLVAEILDSRKAELARVAAVDDLVVSDNLAALLIAQISENPALAPVFDDLFDADGAAINVKPIEHYVPLGKSISYGELVAIASAAHGESAIGYRVAAASRDDASTGVRLNPNKNDEFTPAAGDGLIVIGDVE
jgi:Trk K+ transport system NAD-binding subunit